jgi:hypothetical protein
MKPMQPMTPRRRFRPLSLLISLGLILVVASGACSRNGEGERCDFDNGGSFGNTDCDDGLACISSENLRNSGLAGSRGQGRCCPADENAPISDERCERGTPSGAGGTGGSGTDGGDGGDAAAAGAAGLGGAAGQPGVDAGNDAADASIDAVDGQAGGDAADSGDGAPADASSG